MSEVSIEGFFPQKLVQIFPLKHICCFFLDIIIVDMVINQQAVSLSTANTQAKIPS